MTKRRQSLRDAPDQPVHRAAAGDSEELVRLLDAEPGLRDEPGSFGRRPLHAASEAGNEHSVEILLDRGADPDAEDGLHYDTPLISAVEADSPACVSLLLDTGSGPDKPGRRGQTPIFVARSKLGLSCSSWQGSRRQLTQPPRLQPFPAGPCPFTSWC